MFWLFTIILGWPGPNDPHPFLDVGIWVACVFLSILLHEFGHIWAGRLFGSDGYIVLYSFGGLAVNSARRAAAMAADNRFSRRPAHPNRRHLVAAAIVVCARRAWKRLWRYRERAALDFIFTLLQINLYWPLLNLLPIWPLDGGMVTRDVCTWLSPRHGLRWSLVVSIVTAGGLAINSLAAMRGVTLLPHVPTGGWYMVLLFGVLAYESGQLRGQVRQARAWHYEEPDDRLPWER